jgi:hypothetical protein
LEHIAGNKSNKALQRGVKKYGLSKFIFLHLLFYTKKKIKGFISFQDEIIYELLTPVALAHWIQGDGLIKGKGLSLCTDSYSLKDVIKLMNVLTTRYGFKCTIHLARRDQYRIYILSKSMESLRRLVIPYMVMLYKIGL